MSIKKIIESCKAPALLLVMVALLDILYSLLFRRNSPLIGGILLSSVKIVLVFLFTREFRLKFYKPAIASPKDSSINEQNHDASQIHNAQFLQPQNSHAIATDFALVIVLLPTLFGLNLLVSILPGAETLTSALPTAGSPILLAIMIVLAVVYEEMLYRRYLLDFARQSGLGRFGAVMFSSLIFAAGHLYNGVPGAVFAVLAGSIFAFMYVFRGRLWPVILLHSAYNLVLLVIHGNI